MGLYINGLTNEVVVDHQSSEYLFTTSKGNPVVERVHGVNVRSVFKRVKASGKRQNSRNRSKSVGDNCPLIYALKEQQNLWVSQSSVKSLNEYIPIILSKICDSLDGSVTCIVPIPSNYPLARILSKRLSRSFGVEVFDDVFRKNNFFQASRRAASLLEDKSLANYHGLTQNDLKKIRNYVKNGMKQGGASYSAKCIGTQFREWFDPLRSGPSISLLKSYDKVLLVDDLLASGGTLDCASNILKNRNILESNNAVTWFSGV